METRASKRRKVLPEQSTDGTILQLNIDCLRYVFSFLNVWELMVTEKVCQKFKAMAKDSYKIHRKLDLTMPIHFRISSAEADKIFRRVGPYLENLKLPNYVIRSKNPLKFVWMFCKNLQTVSFCAIDVSIEIAQQVSYALKNVINVEMRKDGLTDSVLSNMFNLKQLRQLHISGINSSGNFLMNLQDIQDISISLSLNFVIAPNIFVTFAQANTQLRSLDISFLKGINGRCLNAIAKNLINLECLCITLAYDATKENYLQLMDLPKLKDLTLREGESHFDFDNLIAKVSAHDQLERLSTSFFHRKICTMDFKASIARLTHLKKLEIAYPLCDPVNSSSLSCIETLEKLNIRSSGITSIELENLIKRCKKIRYIDVNSCKQLTGDFIPNILSHLEGRHHKLVIDVSHTKILWEDFEGTFNPDLLKLVYFGLSFEGYRYFPI